MRYKSQKGITFIGFLLLMSLFAFVAFITMRVAPLYLDAASLRSIMTGLEDKSFVDRSAIVRQLDKNLKINNIVRITSKDFEISSAGFESFKVKADLELVSTLFGNLSIQLKFKKQIVTGRSGQ